MTSEADPRPPGHYLCWCGTVVSPGRVPGAVLYETDGERHKCPLPRATERHQDHPGGDRGTEPDASPGGVRVVWTEEAMLAVQDAWAGKGLGPASMVNAAVPHLRVEVDPKDYRLAVGMASDKAPTTDIPELDEFARRLLDLLGIHLSDGGTDE